MTILYLSIAIIIFLLVIEIGRRANKKINLYDLIWFILLSVFWVVTIPIILLIIMIEYLLKYINKGNIK